MKGKVSWKSLLQHLEGALGKKHCGKPIEASKRSAHKNATLGIQHGVAIVDEDGGTIEDSSYLPDILILLSTVGDDVVKPWWDATLSSFVLIPRVFAGDTDYFIPFPQFSKRAARPRVEAFKSKEKLLSHDVYPGEKEPKRGPECKWQSEESQFPFAALAVQRRGQE